MCLSCVLLMTGGGKKPAGQVVQDEEVAGEYVDVSDDEAVDERGLEGPESEDEEIIEEFVEESSDEVLDGAGKEAAAEEYEFAEGTEEQPGLPGVPGVYERDTAGGEVYRVWIWQETGDSLWNLAEKFYGDPWKWKLIYLANQDVIDDPSKIYPKQELIIPAAPVYSEEEYSGEEYAGEEYSGEE